MEKDYGGKKVTFPSKMTQVAFQGAERSYFILYHVVPPCKFGLKP